MGDIRKKYVQLKAKIALEAVKGDKTIRELSSEYGDILADNEMEETNYLKNYPPYLVIKIRFSCSTIVSFLLPSFSPSK